MKFLAWICGILLVLVVALYCVLFSSFGNSVLKPFVEKIASEKIGMEFKLEKFELGFSSFDILAIINGELSVESRGKYSLFSSQFDLNYNTQAKSFNGMQIDLSLKGEALGSFDNFVANGSGSLAGSSIRFASRIKDYAPLELKLDAKELDLAALSMIALKKAYISGKLSAVADIAGQEGTAKLNSAKIIITKEAQNDFGISLPANFALSLNSDIKLLGKQVAATTRVKSALANLSAKNTSYNFENGEITSDFNMDIANLAALEPIIKQKLNGSIKVAGNTKIANGAMEFLDAKINGLGGEILASLKDNELNANIKNLKLAQALSLAGLAPLANSDISGTAKITNLSDTKKIKGSANLTLSNGVLNHKQMNSLLGSDLSSDVSFNAQNKLEIASGTLNFDSVLNSPVIENLGAKGSYTLANGDAKIDLAGKIADLGAIFGSGAKSPVNIKANVGLKAGELSDADIDIKGFGGEIIAKVKGKALNANIKNIKAEQVLAMTTFGSLINGEVNAELSLDGLKLQNLNGRGELSVKNGVFNAAAISKLLKTQFPENVKFSLNFKPTFTNSVAYFSSNFASDIANISKFDGSYNLQKNTLDATYSANVSDLSKLSFLTGVALYTPLNLSGKIASKEQAINASANSDIFGSNTDITFKSGVLNANMKNAKIEQILKALGYEQFYIGTTNMAFDYNTASKFGEFNANILNAHLAKSGLTVLISSVLGGRDITTEVYENGVVKGRVQGDIITFDANMHSKRSDINVEQASINTKSKALKIPVSANYEKTDIGIDITGTTEAPKYALSSQYLKQKAEQGVEKLIDKAFKGNDEKADKAKDILNNLKKLF
ncbi:MAG: AsmA-like C-terminal region-containing protein [Campylobacter sp.]|nr:AsmA-like C-terminal region-containing protein [Campylobacter sp.]